MLKLISFDSKHFTQQEGCGNAMTPLDIRKDHGHCGLRLPCIFSLYTFGKTPKSSVSDKVYQVENLIQQCLKAKVRGPSSHIHCFSMYEVLHFCQTHSVQSNTLQPHTKCHNLILKTVSQNLGTDKEYRQHLHSYKNETPLLVGCIKSVGCLFFELA